LPTGVTGSANHSNNYYDVWGGDSLGCVHFCGTPVAPGTYYVVVNLLADVVAVGTPIGNVTVNGQAQTYRDTLVIYPSTSACPQSFSLGGPCITKACDSVTVNLDATLTNTHCSNLITYSWDLGNGTRSNVKTPGRVNYNIPDTFRLSLLTTYYTYRIKSVYANITGGYYPDIEELTAAQNPDPYIIIPSLGFNNRSNAGSDTHGITFNNLNLVIPGNNCADPIEIQVWDEDTGPPQGSNPLGSPDDNCDSHYITPAIPNQVSDVSSNSSISVKFDTVAISSVPDTVLIIVYPHPPVPVIVASKDSICSGDSTVLGLTQAIDGYGFTWYMNDTTELTSTDSVVTVSKAASYKVKITNLVTGCQEISAPYILAVGQSPQQAGISFNGTQVFINPFPGPGYAVDWYFNGNLVAGQNGKFLPYMGAGLYSADLYNASFPNCRVSIPADSVVSGINDVAENSILDLTVFPNPNTGKFHVKFSTAEVMTVTMSVRDMIGETVITKNLENLDGTYNEEIDLANLSKGVYFVTVESKQGRLSSKVVVQ
jgi:hypothetical protein